MPPLLQDAVARQIEPPRTSTRDETLVATLPDAREEADDPAHLELECGGVLNIDKVTRTTFYTHLPKNITSPDHSGSGMENGRRHETASAMGETL